MPLRAHDAVQGSNYFYIEEVIEVLHILHFEWAGAEHLDVVDIGNMFSFNYQFVDIYYDE